MKLPSSKPLTEAELDFLNDVLSVSEDDEAIMCVSELDGFLTATIRTGPKVGRNDPCPCGSGKKFKQCCLH